VKDSSYIFVPTLAIVSFGSSVASIGNAVASQCLEQDQVCVGAEYWVGSNIIFVPKKKKKKKKKKT
jgi:hypothetical protein